MREIPTSTTSHEYFENTVEEIRSLRKQLAQREKDLELAREYVRHKQGTCMRFDSSGDAHRCSCGLSEFLSSLSPKETK